MIKNNKTKKGFIILFTVMLTSIILTIALGVSNVAIKEINFSTSAKNTNDAFLSADIGAECTLLNDKSTYNKFPLSGPATSITCGGLSYLPTLSTTTSTALYSFTITGLGNSTQGCAKITVYKDNTVPPIKTTIISRGYNIGNASCESTDPARVERELNVTYGDSVDTLPSAIGYWKFDEGSGSVAADSSGSGNNGLLTNGGDWVGGKFNGGLSTDTGNSSSVIQVSPISIGANWTLAWWSSFPIATTPNWRTMFRGAIGAEDHQVLVSVGGDLGVYDSSGIGFRSSGYNVNSLSGWHHVAAVGTGSTTVFYIDGVVVGSPIAYKSTSNIDFIGNCGLCSAQNWGKFDDLRIYNQALSASQIQTVFNLTPSSGVNRSLAVTISGAGSGSVSSSPSGINNCSTGTCNASFSDGASVTLSTSPDVGSVFSGWTGDCSGTSSCNLVMSSNKNATATFNVSGTPAPAPSLTIISTEYISDGSQSGMSRTGATYTLSWASVANATTCTLDGVGIPTTGGTAVGTVGPWAGNSRTFTLSCTGPGGSGNSSVTINHPPAVTVASGSCDSSGTLGTFTWTAPSGYTTFYTRASVSGVNLGTNPPWNDNFVGTSTSFSTTAGTTYDWWVNAKDTTTGAWGVPYLGSFTCTSSPSLTSVEVLVIAGGGGGGQTIGGGGGAGGLLLSSSYSVTPISYTVTVGAGGAGAPAANCPAVDYSTGGGTNGSNSSFGTLTSIGGGGGGNFNHVSNGASTGGSGGGLGGGAVLYLGASPMAGTAEQGNTGGTTDATGNDGGGGGGAGAIGGFGASGGGAGGAGVSSTISGSSIVYAGGGGGGARNPGGGAGGAGWLGVSGAGGAGLVAGSNAIANRGGGGGGGGFDNSNICAPGGDGGSGIVIIRYLGAQQATGGTITSLGGYTIHTFTSSGTFVVGGTAINRNLAVTISGAGSGSVSSAPTGINSCSSGTCNATFTDNTTVTLTATVNSGSTFSGWSGPGGCTGTSSCVLSMDADKNATATFTLNAQPNLQAGIPTTGGSLNNVTWTSIVGATASGNILSKNTGNGWNAGASSSESILSGDGYVEFSSSSTGGDQVVGLSKGNDSTNWLDIDYGIELGFGGVYVADNISGNYPSTGLTYTPSDVFKIAAESGLVKYYKNNILFYTSPTPLTGASYPLLLDTALYYTGDNISNAVISSGGSIVAGTPVTFTSTITNNGTASTGGSFSNIFQTSNSSSGTSPTDFLVSPNMSALAINGSADASTDVTFSSSGTRYIRACADLSSAGIGSVINESSESDNCSSPWTAVTVTAPANNPPVANAGIDQNITLPTNSVTLNGTLSSDSDGSIVSYVWTQDSGPSTVNPADTSTTSASPLIAGTYVFRLTVTDNLGSTGTDTVSIVVNPAPVSAIVFVGQATASGSTATIPAHNVGDLILLFAYRDGSNTPPTMPSGWIAIPSGTGSGANTNSSILAYRIATGSDSGVGWTNASETVVQVYRGVNVSPIGGNGDGGGNGTTVTYPTLTMSVTNGTSWVAGFAGHRSTNTSLQTSPALMSPRSTLVDATAEVSGHDTNSGVTSWSATPVSVGGTGSGWRARTVEIKSQ